MESLVSKKCVPCEGGVPPFSAKEIAEYLPRLDPTWKHVVSEGVDKIQHEFQFKDFAKAMEFVNKVAIVAEGEGHHPDIHVSYNKVRIVTWTHAVKGLSENDFILAAKLNTLTPTASGTR